MNAERFTRCPHCKATFKVSEDQLSVANGRVRCGACMNIFDAIAYTVSDSEAKPAPPSFQNDAADSDTQPAPTNPVELEDSLLSETAIEQTVEDPDLHDDLIQDDPEEDNKDAIYSGSSMSDELSTSFMELDESNPSTPYSTEITEIDTDFDAADESWTEEVLENDKASDTKRVEPTFSENNNEAPNADGYFNAPDSAGQDSYSSPPKEQIDESESIQFYYDQDKNPRSRRWLTSSLLVILNISFLVLLLAQASWFHYEKLAKYPQLAKLYEQACALLDCKLPELLDISKIKSHNLIVRSHPTASKALIIDAVIINDADFAQPFPNLALYFSDINNQTIAQRLIYPKEYLSTEILNWGEMPSEQPIHISLEIVDPGKQAVNYTLKFFPATPPSDE